VHHSTDLPHDFEIRDASPDDAAALSPLAPSGIGSRTIGDVGAFLRRSDAGACVAWCGAQVAGAVAFVFEDDIVRFFGLAVDESRRRLGIGSALLARVEASARARRAAIVHVQGPRSDAAVAWLERRGYAVDTAERDVIAGEIVELVDMVKVV
jgi:ribosomal protein S18 acetylase RimI-like enzyme